MRAILITALLYLSLASPAGAEMVDIQPLSDPRVASALVAADQVWVEAGFPAPCPVTLFQYTEVGPDADGTIAARATIPSESNGECSVFIERLALARWSTDAPADKLRLCQLLVHERGHNLGYNHVPDVMGDTMLGGHWLIEYPACMRHAGMVSQPPKPVDPIPPQVHEHRKVRKHRRPHIRARYGRLTSRSKSARLSKSIYRRTSHA